MKQYLISVYQPDGKTLPPDELSKVMHDANAWHEELKAADAWVFTAGLYPPSTATVLRFKDGEILVTDGPYTEGK
jgi:hypothetical protein